MNRELAASYLGCLSYLEYYASVTLAPWSSEAVVIGFFVGLALELQKESSPAAKRLSKPRPALTVTAMVEAHDGREAYRVQLAEDGRHVYCLIPRSAVLSPRIAVFAAQLAGLFYERGPSPTNPSREETP